jgi:hypothetical protein
MRGLQRTPLRCEYAELPFDIQGHATGDRPFIVRVVAPELSRTIGRFGSRRHRIGDILVGDGLVRRLACELVAGRRSSRPSPANYACCPGATPASH